PGARMAVFVAVAAAVILFLSGAIPGALGQAFLALGRRHRYWPLLHLGLVILAALGVADLAELVRKSGVAAFKVAAVVLAGAVVFAGLRYPWNKAFSHVSRAGAPLLLTALEGDRTSVLNVLG